MIAAQATNWKYPTAEKATLIAWTAFLFAEQLSIQAIKAAIRSGANVLD